MIPKRNSKGHKKLFIVGGKDGLSGSISAYRSKDLSSNPGERENSF